MEEELKSIKILLPYVTVDGKQEQRMTTVSFKKVVEKEKAEYSNDYSPLYAMNMSLVLPDHIHAKMVGAVVGRPQSFGDRDGRTYKTDFSKTISSSSLEGLTLQYRDILYDYKWLLNRESQKLTKVIFYDFAGHNHPFTKSTWDSKQMGADSKINYGFMFGYISENGKNRYNIDKKYIDRKDGPQHEWKYVEHTPERAVFFEGIFSKFMELLEQLSGFKDRITPETIDGIVANGLRLLN
jgi:hypothetical protein